MQIREERANFPDCFGSLKETGMEFRHSCFSKSWLPLRLLNAKANLICNFTPQTPQWPPGIPGVSGVTLRVVYYFPWLHTRRGNAEIP